MRTNLYFVRHAHSEYTPEEYTRPLSQKGLADAEEVTKILTENKIDVVVSSPYKRAVQTVEGTALNIAKKILIEDDFKERKLSEGPIENFSLAIRRVWENENVALEGGESNLTAQKRGVAATLKVLQDYEGKNVVIGTHGNLMVLIMNYFDKKYDFAFWENLDMPDIYRLTFEKNKLVEVIQVWKR